MREKHDEDDEVKEEEVEEVKAMIYATTISAVQQRSTSSSSSSSSLWPAPPSSAQVNNMWLAGCFSLIHVLTPPHRYSRLLLLFWSFFDGCSHPLLVCEQFHEPSCFLFIIYISVSVRCFAVFHWQPSRLIPIHLRRIKWKEVQALIEPQKFVLKHKVKRHKKKLGNIRLETKSGRILLLNKLTKYELT